MFISYSWYTTCQKDSTAFSIIKRPTAPDQNMSYYCESFINNDNYYLMCTANSAVSGSSGHRQLTFKVSMVVDNKCNESTSFDKCL